MPFLDIFEITYTVNSEIGACAEHPVYNQVHTRDGENAGAVAVINIAELRQCSSIAAQSESGLLEHHCDSI